jgi:phthalate 4,5-dioxygenase oxygenase subunit
VNRTPYGGIPFLPDSDDWLGSHRPVANASNQYLIDRDLQQSRASYSGLPGTTIQDAAIQESMGTIAERTQEHLAESDVVFTRTRRKLIATARAFGAGGTARGVDDPGLYRMYSGNATLRTGTNGLEALADILFARVSLEDMLAREASDLANTAVANGVPVA